MVVVYVDDIGVKHVKIDFNSIGFFNNEVYFSSNYEEYRIPVSALIEIYND